MEGLIIIKKAMKHQKLPEFETRHIQVINLIIEEKPGPRNIHIFTLLLPKSQRKRRIVRRVFQKPR